MLLGLARRYMEKCESNQNLFLNKLLLIFKMYIYNARITVSLNINHPSTDILKRNKRIPT